MPASAATSTTTERFAEYRVSERVTLRQGTLFRATGGPYYEVLQPDGTRRKMSMGYRGPFRFHAYCVRGTHRWIEATHDGTFCVLPIGDGGRSPALPKLVRRGYKIKGRIREKARRTLRRRPR